MLLGNKTFNLKMAKYLLVKAVKICGLDCLTDTLTYATESAAALIAQLYQKAELIKQSLLKSCDCDNTVSGWNVIAF